MGGIYTFFVVPALTMTGDAEIDKRLIRGLDPVIRQARQSGRRRILLNPKETYVDFWKKDDYQI